MAAFVKRRHGLFSWTHEHRMRTGMSVTPNGERDGWGMAATMDHSDIRGLGNALHLFLAGLPRSRDGDHPKGCSLKTLEDSPHRSHASRSQLGVVLEVKVLGDRAPVVVAGIEKDLSTYSHMARHVPDEAGELACNSDADFVLRELSSHRKTAPALGQTQLRLPGDVADDLRLPLLENLETSSDLSLEAIIPRCLHQDTPSVFVTAFGDLTQAARLATGELRGHQSLTTGFMRQSSHCTRSAWVIRSTRSQASLEACRYSLKVISCAGCSKRIVDKCRSCAWLQELFPW
jgi:hypothetical protein